MNLAKVVLILIAGKIIGMTLYCTEVEDIKESLQTLKVLEQDEGRFFPKNEFGLKEPTALTIVPKMYRRKIFIFEQSLTDPKTKRDFEWKRENFAKLRAENIISFDISCFVSKDFAYFVYEKPIGFVPLSEVPHVFPAELMKNFVHDLLDSFKKYQENGAVFAGNLQHPVYYGHTPQRRFVIMDIHKLKKRLQNKLQTMPVVTTTAAQENSLSAVTSKPQKIVWVSSSNNIRAFLSAMIDELLYFPKRNPGGFLPFFNNILNKFMLYRDQFEKDAYKVTWGMLIRDLRRIKWPTADEIWDFEREKPQPHFIKNYINVKSFRRHSRKPSLSDEASDASIS